jgi:hypothetical protein
VRALEDVLDRENPLSAPVVDGRYVLALTILDAASGAPEAEGRNTFWVVSQLRTRLRSIRERAESLAVKSAKPLDRIWINTILAVAECYTTARSKPVRPETQTASPLVQSLAGEPAAELLDPASDIAWAESALAALEKGASPVRAGGWTPLAARSKADQSLRLGRAWWPAVPPAGIALLFGDGVSHERSWVDLTPGGALLSLALPARPGVGGWEGFLNDVEEFLKVLALATGFQEPKPLSMLMIGSGAESGIEVFQKDPARINAMVIISGSTERPMRGVPKGFPPLLMIEAGKDLLVPPVEFRRDGMAFQRGLQQFEYMVLPDLDRVTVRSPGLAKAMEFFSAVAAGVWKPSGTRVPSLPPTR